MATEKTGKKDRNARFGRVSVSLKIKTKRRIEKKIARGVLNNEKLDTDTIINTALDVQYGTDDPDKE